ncbi:hypothetical protein [Pseudarthrobacter sp. S9]|uniref:hypothetical protein n=1 Tax=Pseudarthrobacter sp. S9 TaxID=3418421 RepID=UPI003D053EF9
MTRSGLTGALPVLFSALLLTGCGAGSPVAAPSPSPSSSTTSAEPSPSPTRATPKPTPTAVPAGLKYSLSCSAGGASRTKITDYKAAWATPFDLCTADATTGAQSPAEKAAGTASGGTSPDTAKYLYALCATTAGHYFEGEVSEAQAKEIAAALSLCPDHPKRAALEGSAAAGGALEADRANGKLVYSGKYLVGKDVQPGTWQSQGEGVEDCYWETSDAQGRIIANNFTSVSPQFTIKVPPSAAGFTVEGCGFRWIKP